MQEVKEEVVSKPEIVDEVKTSSEDEIVALFCSYKQPAQVGEDFIEIVKGGEKFFILKAGQFKRMTRRVAQWHIGKSTRWDVTQPLQIRIMTMDEIDALKADSQAKKHAKADADAQAAKAAQAEADKLAAEAATAAKLRRDLLDKALKAGAIESSEEADKMTNKDLAEMTENAKKEKKS